MKINAIITGATGMVGEGVLHECLNHPAIETILVINRKPCGITHPKLKEIIHADFFDITPILTQLSGYNACFFCLGVSSIGLKEPEYTRLTYDLTLNIATHLSQLNPDMTFCYVSGASTDSTTNGKVMWARVKGRTENDLIKLPFKRVYAFRPGYMQPTQGMKNTLKMYTFLSWSYPLLRRMFPDQVSTLKEVGVAMINCAQKDYKKSVLEVRDIVIIAKDLT